MLLTMGGSPVVMVLSLQNSEDLKKTLRRVSSNELSAYRVKNASVVINSLVSV